jgi:hypothetical protein
MGVDLDLEQKHWVFFMIMFCEFFLCVRKDYKYWSPGPGSDISQSGADSPVPGTQVYSDPWGFTKRCRLSWLTNSALVYNEPKCGGPAGSQPISTAVHMEAK